MSQSFAVVSDTHFGSELARPDLLTEFYELAERHDSEFVLHAGDIIDGVKIYKDQADSQNDRTLLDQIRRVQSDYPTNLPTYYVTGNHDVRDKYRIEVDWELERRMNTFTSFGECGEFGLGDYLVRWLHKPKGRPRNPISNYLNELDNEDVPNMLFVGHYHRASKQEKRDCETHHAGCFKEDSDFHLAKGHLADLGGWIVKYKISNGFVRDIKSSFISYTHRRNRY